MASKISLTLFALSLGMSMVYCTEKETEQTEELSVQRRFLFIETLTALASAFYNSMFLAAGFTSYQLFEASYNLNCVACKCFGQCLLEKDLEQYICSSYWDTVDCSVASVPQGFTLPTTPEPVTVTQQTSTGTSSLTIPHCEKFCTIAAVSQKISIPNSNADFCPGTTSQTTSEAFLMSCCKMGNVTSWKQGEKVMPVCGNLPHYTPVAKFSGGQYVEGTAGVFVACINGTEHGFQFVYQECGQVTDLTRVSNKGEIGYRDPENYFVLAEA